MKIKTLKNPLCKGCIYYRKMSGVDAWACHYCVDTGNLRECPAAECDKLKPAPRTGKSGTHEKEAQSYTQTF